MSAADKKVKIALDECRVLMLGAQILFGFHLRAVFQDQFARLTAPSRILYAFAFLSMAIVVGLLIAPSMQHRVVEAGRTSGRILAEATWFAGVALLPFALSLGADITIVAAYRYGMLAGAGLGLGLTLVALSLWYGIEYLWRRPRRAEPPMAEERDTPLDVRVESMLTETRVLLPGAQALFGFQLIVLLTNGFDKLSELSKIVHTMALCAIAISVILLMTPAALHRLAFHGRNSARFHRIGSDFVVASAVPLAAGITGDIYVAVTKALDSPALGAAAAFAIALLLGVLWFAQPLLLRRRRRRHA